MGLRSIAASVAVLASTVLAACTSADFPQAASVPLGPDMTIRSLVQGATVCFQVTAALPSARWVSIGLAASSRMVNTPVSNAAVMEISATATPTVKLYEIRGYSASGVVLQSDQSSISVVQAAVANGVATFTFQRSLTSATAFDVALAENAPTNILWAHGTRAFPSYHDAAGVARIVLSATTGPAQVLSALPSAVTTYTTLIVAGAFVTMVLLGLVATHTGEWRSLNQKTLCAPPMSNNLLAGLTQSAADTKCGELAVVAVYVATLVLVALSVKSQFTNATAMGALSLITGHLALVDLMLLLLPVARGKHWELVFGISHERILKFHRALGRSCVVYSTVHLVINATAGGVSSRQPYGTQQVVPLYGFVSFVAFASMGLLALEPVRRRWYELFYYYHRIAAVVGIVFAMLHSRTVVYAMIFPVAIYGLSGLFRLRAFCNSFDATIDVHGTNTVTLVLPSTAQTKRWAATMNPCAFFWVCVPSVSATEWHPFSAIVTPDQDSIGFCMKAPSKGSFVDGVFQAATKALYQDASTLRVRVGGPYGKPAVDVAAYDHVVLVAGGIGVTPMLSLLNQHRDKLDPTRHAQLELHWVVRHPDELLSADRLMFPLPAHVRVHLYATAATDAGSILSSTGETVHFGPGKPVLDELINRERFLGKKACVLACGPPGLVADAQRHARAVDVDFHKEVFLF
ncbi:transmembrane protein [Achlya hypogyna]|uniref:Transmembrane protein n=1 Tax=Achlya hypogyna TaxID=1202772 RepID=A0A1V9YUR7_ACHHY|nr:transmembrane protein [Achlya hypogyna]